MNTITQNQKQFTSSINFFTLDLDLDASHTTNRTSYHCAHCEHPQNFGNTYSGSNILTSVVFTSLYMYIFLCSDAISENSTLMIKAKTRANLLDVWAWVQTPHLSWHFCELAFELLLTKNAESSKTPTRWSTRECVQISESSFQAHEIFAALIWG